MRYRLIICLLLHCVYGNSQFNSSYNFTFKTYTTADGLAHNYTRKCKTDSKGFLWIATQNGLSCFDGYQFINFFHDPNNSYSLPSNNLWDIDIDEQDHVWLAYESGACFYDPSTQRFIVINGFENRHSTNKLVVDRFKPLVWILSDEGLMKFDRRSGILYTTRLNTRLPNETSSMMLDSKGSLWITIHRYGFYQYNCTADTFCYYNNNDWYTSAYEDCKKDLWLGTWGNGLKRFDKKQNATTKEAYKIIQKPVGADLIYMGITECPSLTGDSILWIVNQSTGLLLFNKNTRCFVKWYRHKPEIKYGIASDFNSNIYTAPDGSLWICSWYGLEKVNRFEQQFQAAAIPQLNGVYYNLLTGIQQDPVDKDILWLSVNGSGIAKYSLIKDAVVQTFYREHSGKNNDPYYLKRWIYNLSTDKNGTIWGVSYGGFVKIKNGKVNFIEVKPDKEYNSSSSGFQSLDGRLWSLGSQGLVSLNPDDEQIDFYKIQRNQTSILNSGDMFKAMAQSPKGKYFVATYNGIYQFTDFRKDTVLISYWQGMKESEKWKICNTLEYIDHYLYIGTSHGLLEYDLNSKRIQKIGEETTISQVLANCLKKDDLGNLWIYSLEGLYRFNPQTRKLNRYVETDGIYTRNTDPAAIFRFDDYMYVGHRMAFTRFKPKEILENTSVPCAYIYSVKDEGNGKIISMGNDCGKAAALRYNQNRLTFSFTAIEYNAPRKLCFEYILEGYDHKWKKTSTVRFAAYTSLAEGDYSFKVYAINSSGIRSKQSTVFRFVISPPWWRTGWFRILMLATIAVCIYLFLKWRIRVVKFNEEQKTAMNKAMAGLEMKALQSQMNPHFIFNSLNSVQKYIWENRQKDASEYLAKFARLIRLVLENSLHSTVTLFEELAALRLYIEMEHRRNNQRFDYSIILQDGIDADKILVPPLLLQPYVENAIWHGLSQKQGKGKLSVEIRFRENCLLCIIDDDGIGRKKAGEIQADKVSSHSLALNISSQRIAWLKQQTGKEAAVEIRDNYLHDVATGTTVLLTLPYINIP